MRQMTVPNFKTPETGYKIYQRFRGLDLSTDETQIDDSRSPKMGQSPGGALGGHPGVAIWPEKDKPKTGENSTRAGEDELPPKRGKEMQHEADDRTKFQDAGDRL